MTTWSRLDGVVLYYHTGHVWGYAVTGTFKVLPLRFESTKLAMVLPQGWYRLTRRLANRRIVIKSPEELVPVTEAEMAKICWKMRVRFGKLLAKVRATKRRKITDEIIITPFSDVPFITDRRWYIYVLMTINGAVNIKRIPRSDIYELARGCEDDYVAVYIAKDYIGVIHFSNPHPNLS